MKVVSTQLMASLEKKAYGMGYHEKDFMEKAGERIAQETERYIEEEAINQAILVLCGKGNNGGDACVAARYLLKKGFAVVCFLVEEHSHCSPLCQQNADLFVEEGGKLISQLPDLSSFGIIIDGLFGTGFKGCVKNPYLTVIQRVNNSHIPILAVDIPSGLNGSTGQAEGEVVVATETLALGLPKTGFFLDQGWNYVGELKVLDFGLPSKIIDEQKTNFVLLTQDQIRSLLPKVKRKRNKYEAGYVIALAGSPGMPGAALLSTYASLRGGSGMVRLLHPEGMQNELSASPYELIKVLYQWKDTQSVFEWLEKGSATLVGPGIGRSAEIKQLLKEVMPNLSKPCVIDADALTLLSEESFTLPKHAILTPHTGEMGRLLKRKITQVNEDLLDECQRYVDKNQITLVLKGAPTFILHPGKPISINPTGDPGMATAGSGDVLTGLIASLLSQGLNSQDAACVGVYLHGLAGQYAATIQTSYSLIASDLIEHFPDAYQLTLRKI